MNKKYKKPILIAEIGCNHKGDFQIAKKMIEIAATCGADYVKFQKRNNRFLLGNNFNKPHPVPENSYGNTYGEHRNYLEFSIKQHKQLQKHCIKNKIKYATSVWEIKSAEEIIKSKIPLDFIKVPSACNLDFSLLKVLATKFKKDIHISLGMTTQKEILKIFNFFKKFNRHKSLIFYVCTSDYPSKFSDICLLEISKLNKKYKNKIKDIAFSGHHLGISVDNVAYALGANIIERHFTLDRTWKGTDHAASLEPDGLKKLKRDLINTCLSLKEKPTNKILKSEIYQRKKLKRLNYESKNNIYKFSG
jgi:N-acetylneuraminate synthase